MKKFKISNSIAKYFLIIILVLGFILPNLIHNPLNAIGTKIYEKKIPRSSYQGIVFNNTFNISQSQDDAWTNNTNTDFSSETLLLGGHNALTDNLQKRICLRWSLSIPKNARIVNAYLNFTVNKTTPTYNGFRCQILTLNDINTPPFNNVNESVWHNRPRAAGSTLWDLPASISANQSILSPDISARLQPIVNRETWSNNSIFGIIIRPTNFIQNFEHVEAWSYDGLYPQFTPKLYVEWEDPPYFIEVPPDLDIQNDTKGYYLEWKAIDDNPTTYEIYRNSSLDSGGLWQSGALIHYDIPSNLGIGIYNFTIIIYNGIGNYDVDSVWVNVTTLNIPVISKIDFIQNEEVRDYCVTGDGPFTVKLYNNTPITVDVVLSAYYANYNATLVTYIDLLGDFVDVFLSPFSVAPGLRYTLNYTNGAFQFTPSPNDQYVWMFIAWIIPLGYYYKNVSSIEANVINFVKIEINGGNSFIYNSTHYNYNNPSLINPLIMNIPNRDINAPIYDDPELYIPNDPSLNYEIQLNATDGEFESGIKSVTIFYSVSGSSWQSVEMLHFEGLYFGDIPRQDAELEVRYYIKLTDYSGNSVETPIYKFFTPKFEEPPLEVLIITLLSLIGVTLAIGVFFRFRNKRRFLNKTRKTRRRGA